MFSTTMAGLRTPRIICTMCFLAFCPTLPFTSAAGAAQTAAPAAAPASTNVSQVGTVKSISGRTLVLTADKGGDVSITVPEGARMLQVAPGSKDLKAAQTITLTDIANGDRVLVTAKPGDGTTLTAIRVILQKSGDIAEKHAAEAADWQKRGGGGIVTAVKGTTLTIASGSKKIDIQTGPTTIFRRYAPGSVKFEDAVPGTLAQLKAGDQLRVRGDKSADGLTITADEIVSGSFRNLSGVLTSVSADGTSIAFKDLASKKAVTVLLTPNSEVKELPANAARMMARANAGGGASAQGGGQAPAGGPAGGPGAGRSMDLSSMVARLPKATPEVLKPGAAVMVVASNGASMSDAPTAITVLTGVEALLTANPDGAPGMSLSPMSTGVPGGMGGGEGPE